MATKQTSETAEYGTIRTTYFSNVGAADGVAPAAADDVFGVVRQPASFVEEIVDRNVAALAPPEQLLEAFKRVEESAEDDGHDQPARIAWESVNFEARYEAFVNSPELLDVLRTVAVRPRTGRDVYLVCYERDPRWCHRRLLAARIAEVADVDLDVEHHPSPREVAAEGPAEADATPGVEQQQSGLHDYEPVAGAGGGGR